MDSHIELGRQLLSSIAAKADGVRGSFCADDPFEANKALIQPCMATEQGPSCITGMPHQNLKMGQGFLMVEGCVRTKDPHLAVHHVRLGIKVALAPCSRTEVQRL